MTVTCMIEERKGIQMKAVILAGNLEARIAEETSLKPIRARYCNAPAPQPKSWIATACGLAMTGWTRHCKKPLTASEAWQEARQSIPRVIASAARQSRAP